jgi:hypothetical protein
VGDDGTFGNRFDDFDGYFRVLYAASSPLACFVETLARYRPPPGLAAAFDQIENAPGEDVPFGKVPLTWLRTRLLGQAVSRRKRFADVYRAEWLAYLRRRLEPGASQDFDLALLLSQDRKLTQQVSTIAYQLGYDGIYYQSRHGSNLANWALFEPFQLDSADSVSPTPDNSEFQAALRLLNLTLDTISIGQTSFCLLMGSSRMRFPVAAKIALAMAGAIGGTPGSPAPVGKVPLSTK